MRSPNNEDGMHRRIGWMTPTDESILEFLDGISNYKGEPAIQTPKSIAKNIPYSRHHIGNRCRTLADHDLLERVDTGEYRLTDRGVSLLDGGIEPEALEESDG